MKPFLFFFLLFIPIFCFSQDSVTVISAVAIEKAVAETTIANPDTIFRVNNSYDEYVKKIGYATVYVAPKMYVYIRFQRGDLTYFGVDLFSDTSVDGKVDRLMRVPGQTSWSENLDAHLTLLGSFDLNSIRTEIDLVSTFRMIENKPYLNRMLFWKTDENWHLADFNSQEIGNVSDEFSPQGIWEIILDNILPQ